MFLTVHALFETLAFFVGYRYYLSQKKKYPGPPISDSASWGLICGGALGALIGSRLIAGLENPELFLQPPTWLYYIGSQTIAGGIAGGVIGVEIAKKVLKLKRKTGDIFVYPLILAVIIGRIGCLLTGVSDGTVGNPSDLPWAFDQGDGISRHPTSLYEILFLIIVWGFLKKFELFKKRKEGDLFVILMMSYFTFRFFVEFIKPIEPLFLGLSSIQLTSLCVVLYYVAYLLIRKK